MARPACAPCWAGSGRWMVLLGRSGWPAHHVMRVLADRRHCPCTVQCEFGRTVLSGADGTTHSLCLQGSGQMALPVHLTLRVSVDRRYGLWLVGTVRAPYPAGSSRRTIRCGTDGTAYALCLTGSSRQTVRFEADGIARKPCRVGSSRQTARFVAGGTAHNHSVQVWVDGWPGSGQRALSRAPCRAGSGRQMVLFGHPDRAISPNWTVRHGTVHELSRQPEKDRRSIWEGWHEQSRRSVLVQMVRPEPDPPSVRTFTALCAGSAICPERGRCSSKTRTTLCAGSAICPEPGRRSARTRPPRTGWMGKIARLGILAHHALRVWVDGQPNSGRRALFAHRAVHVRANGQSGSGPMALRHADGRSCSGRPGLPTLHTCWFGQTDTPVRAQLHGPCTVPCGIWADGRSCSGR